tara:strand:+ start:1081 stop:1434 length:354 start_codon:yes stop_codon:yes gene_type:complete
MAYINLEIRDFEIELTEISLSAWDAGVLLEENEITPDNLREEWAELDRYIIEDCEPKRADEIAELIAGGGWELDALERFISVSVTCLRLRVIAEQKRAAAAMRDLKFGPPLETAEAG